MQRLFRTFAVALVLPLLPGCSVISRPRADNVPANREFATTVILHGKPLELHVTAPRTSAADHLIVLYASGDGGWFGTAVDMFREIGRAGYYAVGFSSRAFLKIERPRGTLATAVQLAAEYEQILAQARVALGLDAATPAVLTGWSRGAAFAVLVGSEPTARDDLIGVIAIGLDEGEDLDIGGPQDETDDGPASPEQRRWPFDTYALIADVVRLPCVVIQATHDNYFPAASARQRFGPDTAQRRLYAVEARNHRFAGSKAAFDATLVDALRWMVSLPVGTNGAHVQ